MAPSRSNLDRLASSAPKLSVAVVVLGDVDRSPRMQYHCRSLVRAGFGVSLVAYRGGERTELLLSHEAITPYYLPEFFAGAARSLFWLYSPLKVLLQFFCLLYTLLFSIPSPSHILVQNPPSIPTLVVCWAVSRLRGAVLVIDWHNLGFTILALHQGSESLYVRLYYYFERFFGRLGDRHLTVSKALRQYLESEFQIRSCAVLYDRPPAQFHKATPEEASEFMKRTEQLITDESFPAGETLLTERVEGCCRWKRDRPFLFVCSSSWSLDDDFNILIKSLSLLDKRLAPNVRIVMAMTGKGPMRDAFLTKVEALSLSHIEIRCLWLEVEDYPRFLGCCDLGISLHFSSSGLDLPMKVLSYYFTTIEELIVQEENGLTFQLAKELTEAIERVLDSFEDPKGLYQKLLVGVDKWQRLRWEDNWDAVVKPILEGAAPSS